MSSMFDFLNGKSVLVTGGTGSFGQQCVEALLDKSETRRIVIFSRDELKQSQMLSSLRDPDGKLRFFLGDIRDRERLSRAFRGVDIVIHAAALKQVPALEYNPSEAIQTNILGTQNVINAAIDCAVEKLLLISSDKAANPANLYGATKLCAEKLAISGNFYASNSPTRISACRYGNVLGSRGSLLKLIEKQQSTGVIFLTHEEMTRFWLTLAQSVELVMNSLRWMQGGEIFVPKPPSMRVKELLTTLAPKCEVRIIGIRPGEKLHEVLVTPEEARHTWEYDDSYIIYPAFSFGKENSIKEGGRPLASGYSFRSDTNSKWLDGAQLLELINSVS